MSDTSLLFAKAPDSHMASALSDNVREMDEENYLIFRSHGIYYGVQADYVNEILTELSITRVPMTPEYVRGVINLRGLIPPIIDFRLLLGRYTNPEDDFCVIVLNIEGSTIGIMVDAVDQMVSLNKATILPVPTQKEQGLVFGMCTIPGSNRTVMLMDCSGLLHNQ